MQTTQIKDRFRQFLPVVVDVESGGFDPKRHALLEVCAISLDLNGAGALVLGETWHYSIKPHAHMGIDDKTRKFLGYDPHSALRLAESETQALQSLADNIKKQVKQQQCTRAILVGHNAAFDLAFINEAFKRQNINSPLHSFSTFDTVTLAAAFFGQTVLNQVCHQAGLGWDKEAAHSALYDCTQTAKLFCKMLNDWQELKYA